MVIIKKYANIIPIDFGEFTLEYNANDDSIKKLQQIQKTFETEVSKIQDSDDESALTSLNEFSKKYWTELFDLDTFDKVYEFSGQSTLATANYLLQTILGIINEFAERNSEDKFLKYLDK